MTLVLRGTAGQVALAEWLFKELDNPAQQRREPVFYEYCPSGGGDDVARIFYLAHTGPVSDLNEAAVLARVLTDIRQLVTYAAARAVAVRGTANQVGLAEWLFKELDRPVNRQAVAQRQDFASSEYRLPGDVDDVARVFFLANAEKIQDLNEAAALVRTVTEVRRLLTYSAPRAIAMRGTAGRMALAEWLLRELDRPANRQALTQGQEASTREYRFHGDGDADDVVRVFFLAHGQTVQELQQIAWRLRATTGNRRLLTYNPPRAIALRGTAAQVSLAEQRIKELDRPPTQ